MNSKQEALRRIKIAERHLMEAEEAAKRENYPEVVGHSQLVVENAAKAVLSCFRIPSWSHDPSDELKDDIARIQLSADIKAKITELADYAHLLAPEHGKTNYGTVTKLPEELYVKKDAESALKMAKGGLTIAKEFLAIYFEDNF